MLYEFITTHRDALIERTRTKIAKRLAPRPTDRELTSGVPLFLEQLAETLRHTPAAMNEDIGRSAEAHGAALLGLGYTVAQVVHDYGEICQAITELADETDATVSADEFHTLNQCLDNAIAGAVTEYTRLRDRTMADDETVRSGVFAHEMRNRISAAQLAFMAIKSGHAPIGGSVAGVVTRSLHSMTVLIDRAMVQVRLDAGNSRREPIDLHRLMEEAEVDASMEASVHGVALHVAPVMSDVVVEGDPHIVAGALANIMRNALKFTPAGGHVSVRTSVVGERVEIAIEDECGGLPSGVAAELFEAFQQRGKNRSGLGLGLFISRKGVESSGGTIRVEDIPGRGCIFTINLPRMRAAS